MIFHLSQPSCVTGDPKGEKELDHESINYSRRTTQNAAGICSFTEEEDEVYGYD